MPAVDIKQIIDSKPLGFTIKTGNGRWKCQIHPDRASYERSRAGSASGIPRADSNLSSSSASSSSSTKTTASH